MSLPEISFYLFTVFNAIRVVSYLPQIVKVAKDGNGATAISYSTWVMWTAANGSTALYSATNLGDVAMATINLLNAVCCLVVIGITIRKRKVYARQQAEVVQTILMSAGVADPIGSTASARSHRFYTSDFSSVR